MDARVTSPPGSLIARTARRREADRGEALGAARAEVAQPARLAVALRRRPDVVEEGGRAHAAAPCAPVTQS
ncbi:MAG: hypothetical protein HOQ12_14840 [Gemmatimonadaceae bacterium]|nr:hypothetical protein [Gemmatimonadaceae bacterium]